jgi:PKD repeat protein
MKTATARFGPAPVRRAGLALIVLASFLAGASSALAQCTLSGGPTQFEPSPPGVPRETTLNWIGINDFRLYQPSGSQPRLLVSESFGYQVVDLTSPGNPQAVRWEDYRFDPPPGPGPIPCNGDCHGSISSQAISDDGARVLFGLLSTQSSPYSAVVGVPDASFGFTLQGDMLPNNGTVAVQHIGSRYLGYSTDGASLWVADVTNPPGLTAPNSLNGERTTLPGGFQLVVAGNRHLVYRTGTSIMVVDAGSPGPIGSISAGFSPTTIAVGDWNRLAGETPIFFSAEVDPADSRKVYVLAEFADSLGKGAGYSAMLVQSGSKIPLGTFRIPALGGETWGRTASSGILNQGGSLFAVMLAKRTAPTTLYRAYTVPVTAFGAQQPSSFDLTPANFGATGVIQGLNSGGTLYAYIAGGANGWVVPMTCVSSNSPALAGLSVSSYGTPLSQGATVFLGDKIDILATVNPPPASQPLTGFGWNFDYDFHPAEDRGTTPRITAPDNGTLGNPTNPPTAITLVGPCDPKGNGDPTSGAGCWNSVQTNTINGGPDFTGAETPASPPKSLAFAFEANNQYGNAGTASFSLNWKVPAARLVTTQVLTGLALVSGSDGHPLPNSFKWYFGDAPTSLQLAGACTSSTCVPTFGVKGTHYYWLTAAYANGYSTPDYTGASAMGTYDVTDFAPAFTVGGSATGPVTGFANGAVGVSNGSPHGAGVSATYYYNLCVAPCADNYQLWATMGTPSGTDGTPAVSASLPMPATSGSYGLKIKVVYTGTSSGTTYWPDPANVGTFPITVTFAVPEIRFNCQAGFSCQQVNAISVLTGDQVKAEAWISGGAGSGKDANPPNPLQWFLKDGSGTQINSGASQDWTFSIASPGTYTLVMHGYSTGDVNGTITVTQRTTPLSVGVSANPTSASVGANVQFGCYAQGGSGTYNSYSWSFGDGAASAGTIANHAYASAGNYNAICTVQDSAGATASNSVNVSIGGGGTGGPCGSVGNLFHTTNGQYPDNQGGIFSAAAGVPITFVANSGYGTYQWNFGDGQLGSGQSVTHTYGSGGNKTITLTVDGCSKSYTVQVTGVAVNCGGTDFSIGGATYQGGAAGAGGGALSGWFAGVGAPLMFTAVNPGAATAASWDWNWGDGTAHGTGQTAPHTYTAAGTYQAVLTITTSSPSGTCTTQYNIFVSGPSGTFVTRYEDNSVFTASNVTGYKNLVFTASDPPSQADLYTWDYGDGSAHGTGQTVTHSFAPGSWMVQLTVTKGAGSATSTQPLTVVPPPEPPKWVVPGMAYVQGQVAGTNWQSDVTIFNPDATRTATIRVAFLDGQNPVDDYASLALSPKVDIPPLGSIGTANVLGDIFGKPLGSFGALLIQGDATPLAPVVTARTFNVGDGTHGTFGLSVPSASSTGGVSSQASPASSVLIGLRQNDTAYTNVGLVNLKNDWAKVALDFTDSASGAALGTTTLDLKPYQSYQLSRALLATGFTGTSDLFTVRVRLLSGTAVYPYATVIDLQSTDPIVVTPSDSPANAYRMPGLVRLTGANGEKWRSRFTIGNPSLSGRSVRLRFSYIPCDAGGCRNRVTIEGDVPLTAGQSLSADDLVKAWLLVSAGIEVSDSTSYQSTLLDVAPTPNDPNQDPLVVLGETYNETPNGHVGLQIPGYTATDGASRSGANRRLVLTGLASTSAYRTNIALFVVGGATGKWVTLHVYSAQGAKLRDVPVQVDAFTQLGSATIFGGLTGDLSRLSVVVDNLDDGVTVGGYATIIDNTSGDATFVKAQPVP